MCCVSGKVHLPEIETPPKPLNGLPIGTDSVSNVFPKRIVGELDALLNEHNEPLKIFKSHLHKLQSDDHAIVINHDKTPAGEHIYRFNAPVVDDVAGIMVGDRTSLREIVIHRRNNNLQFIADTHRSYDVLQYPLMFWKGQDGYCINIKQRDPVSVVQLAIHLENGQRLFFTNETAIDRAVNPPKTTLTEFFEFCNRADDFGAFARTLLYSQVRRYITWAQTKKWMPRKQGSPVDACLNLFKSNTLGRVFTVNPRQTECFYLRLLLVNITGTLSFLDIRTVNGQQYPTYKDAYLALGLLEDDKQWECMLTEAALNCTAIQIRLLFAIVLTTCFPSRAEI
ncbi:hypothetical protein EVAR_10263_1 [Eumeta japonica]|uniref:Helitron helicase-like domain-containing protein n=1 Tax=Eumeta variegata TaxID=151549 RepID=A0A4C1TDJ7_EUMVA|nr:hypothetical protein EVAR_10263_1 [Eumeta japonica]